MRIVRVIVPAGLIGLSLFLGGCQGKGTPESNDKMTIDEVPPQVRTSLRRESGGTPIESINRHELKGNVTYEAILQSEGKMWNVDVDEQGRLLRRQQRPKAE